MITREDLDNLLKDLTIKTPNKEFIIYTGYEGMRTFDLIIKFQAAGVQGFFNIKYYLGGHRARNHSFDILNNNKRAGKYRLPFLYISLVEPNGMYKLRFYHDREFSLHLYYGTELLFVTNNVKDINDHIENQNRIFINARRHK